MSCDSEEEKFQLMQDCIKHMAKSFNENSQPNKIATEVNRHIKRQTGCTDAYFKQKEIGNGIALSLIPRVEEILAANNSLETYVKLSIVGNILDFGAYDINTDFKKLIEGNLNRDLSINDIESFEKSLERHDEVLYLVDNAGEIVFDRILIEKVKEYDVDVTVAVKDGPIVNDACMKEAVDAGLNELGKIITVGSDSGGIVKEMLSKEFKEFFKKSKFIISKGMANYEGLTEMDLSGKDVFCLLCSKCKPISKNLSVDVGSLVLRKIS